MLWSKPFHCNSGCMFRVVVCWKVNFHPSLKSFADCNRSSLRITLYLASFIFPSTLASFRVSTEEKHSHNMRLLLPCFTVGMMYSGWCAVLGFYHTWYFALSSSSILARSDQSTFFQMSVVSHTQVVKNCEQDFLWLSFNNGFLLATLL